MHCYNNYVTSRGFFLRQHNCIRHNYVILRCNFYRIRICLFLLEIHYFQYIVYDHEKIRSYTE
jgi:hypothetical protein